MEVQANKLKQFIEEELGIDVSNLENNTPLFSSGLIDSFSLVSLMAAIERQESITIDPADINLENFDSIERIIRFVENSKLKSA